jgi:hypothetical protein
LPVDGDNVGNANELSKILWGARRHDSRIGSKLGGIKGNVFTVLHFVLEIDLQNRYRKPSNAAENEELLFETERQIVPQSWSADGKSILYQLFDPKTASDLWLLPLDGKQKPVPVLQSAYNENFGQISPDGKWLAYVSDENTRPEVYVVAFPSGPSGVGKRQISVAGGRFPRWRHDSREIFYIDSLSNGKMFGVELTAAGDLLQPGIPRQLFESGYVSVPHLGGDYLPYAVSADGQRFLVPRPINAVSEATSLPSIAVILNWTSSLKAK